MFFIQKLAVREGTDTPGMGYSRKIQARGEGVEDILLYTFRFVTLPLEIPEKTSFLALEILQDCVAPLGNSKVENKDPWKFHISFS